MSKNKEQDYEHRDKLVKGVLRAKRMEAAVQKVAVAKGRHFSIQTQGLQRVDTLARSSSWLV